ncbi:Oxysterol-binding protein-related protein 11 [Taenia crassiceps]|uniref:Oxysterol-binding protein n=1 Tax=Taenia crassiceps TaxID=6207 RepID=A0ABR4QQE3_9CEST
MEGNESVPPANGANQEGSTTDNSIPPPISEMTKSAFLANLDEEVVTSSVQDKEIGSVENYKSVIMHIISQLKDGKDLTQIVLPTFILERRSLLEMFADYNAHPQLLINITNGASADERMKNFLKWYLTAFHVSRKDKVARKPYNPIIGEIFQCSWRLPNAKGESSDDILTTFFGEQVSHHPPISAFQIRCPQRKLELVGSIHTRSQFRALSIYVNMIGKVVLKLGEHNEEYIFSLPTAYGRSILTVPWFELGGTVSVECPQSGYSASIRFHTKSINAKSLHQVSAEMFAPTTSGESKNPVLTVTGHWNDTMEFVDRVLGTTEVIDTKTLNREPKWVRPVASQAPEESQRLWAAVTAALEVGDIDLATKEKTKLEEIQRASEQARTKRGIAHRPRYFRETPNGFLPTHPLTTSIGCSN